MSDIFDSFTKKKEFLVCIDSDGCAMDTMNSKHFYCFGPCMIEEWDLLPWKDEVQRRWNEVNLYTMTRGINRFKGLSMVLSEVDQRYKKIEGIEELSVWVNEAKELSNASLSQRIKEGGGPVLKQALNWSVKVNQMVEKLPEGFGLFIKRQMSPSYLRQIRMLFRRNGKAMVFCSTLTSFFHRIVEVRPIVSAGFWKRGIERDRY